MWVICTQILKNITFLFFYMFPITFADRMKLGWFKFKRLPNLYSKKAHLGIRQSLSLFLNCCILEPKNTPLSLDYCNPESPGVCVSVCVCVHVKTWPGSLLNWTLFLWGSRLRWCHRFCSQYLSFFSHSAHSTTTNSPRTHFLYLLFHRCNFGNERENMLRQQVLKCQLKKKKILLS